MLAFTRALTILYSISLLSLFTHIQLNLIGTRKYVASVRQQAASAATSSSSSSGTSSAASLAALFFGSTADLIGNEWEQHERSSNELGGGEEEVSEETERKSLTLGWWLLNVGWKDVSERVRSAVEDVFSKVSLKSQLGLMDIEALIYEVRQRVEYQDASSEQTVNFLGTLIPGGEPDQEFVLLQGGLSPADAHLDAPLRGLIRSACEYISSADFNVVLRVCMDRGSDVLMRGLREEVFDEREEVGEEGEAETVRLAAVLPAVARWAHLAVNGIPNEVVESLSDLREMTAFSAIMFSTSIDEIAA